MSQPTATDMPESEVAAARGRLAAFVGTWRAEGRSFAHGQQPQDPRASAVPWTSEESYEWLPGEHFLLHRWEAEVGGFAFRGVEILGYDAGQDRYFTSLFDNSGHRVEYAAKVDGPLWTFAEATSRASVRFDGDDRMELKWEWRPHGADWLPLCDRVARRVD